LAQKVIQDADKIVIVGYSFFDDNNKIDSKLFEAVWGKKITIYDKYYESAQKSLTKLKNLIGGKSGLNEYIISYNSDDFPT